MRYTVCNTLYEIYLYIRRPCIAVERVGVPQANHSIIMSISWHQQITPSILTDWATATPAFNFCPVNPKAEVYTTKVAARKKARKDFMFAVCCLNRNIHHSPVSLLLKRKKSDAEFTVCGCWASSLRTLVVKVTCFSESNAKWPKLAFTLSYIFETRYQLASRVRVINI